MEICSERIRIDLTKTDSMKMDFKMKIYPAGQFMAQSKADNGRFILTVENSRTDVDVMSLIGELLDSTNTKSYKKTIGLFSLFDTNTSIYVDFQNPIIQYSFKYEDLVQPKKLEKNILAFDLFYNGSVNALSLLILEALSLVREAFKWKELWVEDF